MNYGLAKEIYGTPWCIDMHSFLSLSSILKNIQNGVSLEIPDIKLNSVHLLKNETRIIDRAFGNAFEPGQLENNDDFEAIGLINLNGPITRNGGMSSYGTVQISDTMMQMSKDRRMKGFVIINDSGGGSSGAVQVMVDTINEIKQKMPVYTLIPKGGMSASAAYGIASASKGVYAEDGMSIVGSVGTMISFDGYKANSESPDGVKHVTVYASKSTMKNKAFEEALNNDNYELLVNELLDPINENFINLVQENRPQLKGTNFDNGHTVFSKDAIGTFIDGIASFDEVVQMVIGDSKKMSSTNKNNINSKSNNMTKEEFKNAHPAVFNEILQEGATAEQERVSAWMVHASTDMVAVQEGINSGKQITSTDTQKFLVKQVSIGNLDALKNDGAAAITTNSAEGLDSSKDANSKAIEDAFNF